MSLDKHQFQALGLTVEHICMRWGMDCNPFALKSLTDDSTLQPVDMDVFSGVAALWDGR